MFDSSVNERLWDFLLSGGVFMAFIAGCSFVAVAVSIHRALTLRWKAIIPPDLAEELRRCSEHFRQRKTSRLLLILKRSDSPMGRIGRVALSPEFPDRETSSEAVEATAKEQMVKLENGMGVLEVVITIAPLLGLLGTVSGLVNVFATLGAEADVTDPTLIAAGIALALNTTIAGLVVAIITVIVHSYFTRRLEGIAARLEVISGQLVNEFHKHGGASLYQAEPRSASAAGAPEDAGASEAPAAAARTAGGTPTPGAGL